MCKNTRTEKFKKIQEIQNRLKTTNVYNYLFLCCLAKIFFDWLMLHHEWTAIFIVLGNS